jgi:TPR repeat protein
MIRSSPSFSCRDLPLAVILLSLLAVLLGCTDRVDAKKATQWLELAAGRGQVDAQSILDIMYATGQGVARNIPEAKKWLTRASEAGDKHAIRMLQMIEGPR